MPDIEGTEKHVLSNIYLYPVIKRPLADITGDDGAGDTSSIEGTEE
jgi:hypothetical protein